MSEYKRVSLTATATELLRQCSKQFSVDSGRRVTLSETVERLVKRNG